MGMLLNDCLAPLETGKRAGVYLTNALTGWDKSATQNMLPFPEMQKERESATAVKQGDKVWVIIGNPPYSGYAGMASLPEERLLSDAYRTTIDPSLPRP